MNIKTMQGYSYPFPWHINEATDYSKAFFSQFSVKCAQRISDDRLSKLAIDDF